MAAVEPWVVVLGHWAAGPQVIRNGLVHGRMERSLRLALNRKYISHKIKYCTSSYLSYAQICTTK